MISQEVCIAEKMGREKKNTFRDKGRRQTCTSDPAEHEMRQVLIPIQHAACLGVL